MSGRKGQTKIEVTELERKQVASMIGMGATHQQVADQLGISGTALRKHFKEELLKSSTKANVAVAGELYKNAMKGNVAAQIFWCKARLGWREKDSDIVIPGGGKDLKTTVTINLKSKEEKGK